MKNLNTEIICYNEIYLSKTYMDDTLYMVTWYDSNTNEIIRKDGYYDIKTDTVSSSDVDKNKI